MYAVSQAYREAMKKPVQRHSIKGTVNGAIRRGCRLAARR